MTCTYTTAPSDAGTNHPAPPPSTPTQITGTATVTLVTNKGTVVWTVDAATTPCTLNSFRYLAGLKYFDNTPCHRITTQGIFVLQCGDPTGTGSGGPGYSYADEALSTVPSSGYAAGSIAMANAGPDTNGSQFFLNYKATSGLMPAYTPWGTVTSGLDVLQSIGMAGAQGGAADGAPASPVTITTLTVSPAS